MYRWLSFSNRLRKKCSWLKAYRRKHGMHATASKAKNKNTTVVQLAD
jgi:hypothetical protein